MIYKNETQVELEFGEGDICVNSGYFINESNSKVGLVTFTNQSKREIGSKGDITIKHNSKVSDFPLIMTFTRTESIDEIIKALLVAKNDIQSVTK